MSEYGDTWRNYKQVVDTITDYIDVKDTPRHSPKEPCVDLNDHGETVPTYARPSDDSFEEHISDVTTDRAFDQSCERSHSRQTSSASSASTNTALNQETYFLIGRLAEVCAMYDEKPHDMVDEGLGELPDAIHHKKDVCATMLTAKVDGSSPSYKLKKGTHLNDMSKNDRILDSQKDYESRKHDMNSDGHDGATADSINDAISTTQTLQASSKCNDVATQPNKDATEELSLLSYDSSLASQTTTDDGTSALEVGSGNSDENAKIANDSTNRELLSEIVQTLRAMVPCHEDRGSINEVVRLRDRHREEWTGASWRKLWTENSNSDVSVLVKDTPSECCRFKDVLQRRMEQPHFRCIDSSGLSINTETTLSTSSTAKPSQSLTDERQHPCKSSSEGQYPSSLFIRRKIEPLQKRYNVKNVHSESTSTIVPSSTVVLKTKRSFSSSRLRRKRSIVEYYTTPGVYKMYAQYKRQRQVSCYNFFKVFFFICCCCHGVKLDNNPDI